MRSLLVLAPVALLAVACSTSGEEASAAASDVVASTIQGFDCTTDAKVDGDIQHLQFSVKDMDKKGMDILDPNGKPDEESYSPIKVQPEEGRVPSLNENLAWDTANDRLTLHGDSDGFYLVDLVLFKDSGYQKGYLRISHSEDGDAYSLVSCKVKPITAP
jgi:hypothetical protein